MTTEAYNRRIHDIYSLWTANLITAGEKQRLVQQAEDNEVAECQAAVLKALSQTSVRLTLLTRRVESMGYSAVTISKSLIQLLNCDKVALTASHYLYLRNAA